MTELRRTPLTGVHELLGARMVEFAGFSMPVQYTSIREEHLAVRGAAGLFDASHMGQFRIEGAGAAAACDALLSRSATSLRRERARYALLCNERGGVVDDIMLYRLEADAFLLCVNASNVDKDRDWIEAHLGADAQLRDVSDETALLALQGPASAEVMRFASCQDAAGLGRFHFGTLRVADRDALISRTGYTGADGFEIYCAAADAETIFEALLAAGKSPGLLPAGLGARDTLRLEAALPLYGHELSDDLSPLEAGLDRFVDLEGHEFIGADAIRSRRDAGHPLALAGFVLEERGVARAEYPVAVGGKTVGYVTSGAPSPTLGKSIGLAYVPPSLAAPGTALEVIVRGRAIGARVVEIPFVTGAQAGRSER